MIFLALLAVTFALAASLVAGFNYWLSEPDRRLRLAFPVVVVLGLAIAWWCAFHVWYQPKATLRVRGVPLPSQMLQLERGDWVPFEGPGWMFNLAIVTSIVAMPLSITLIVRGRRRQRDARQRGFEVVASYPPPPPPSVECEVSTRSDGPGPDN